MNHLNIPVLVPGRLEVHWQPLLQGILRGELQVIVQVADRGNDPPNWNIFAMLQRMGHLFGVPQVDEPHATDGVPPDCAGLHLYTMHKGTRDLHVSRILQHPSQPHREAGVLVSHGAFRRNALQFPPRRAVLIILLPFHVFWPDDHFLDFLHCVFLAGHAAAGKKHVGVRRREQLNSVLIPIHNLRGPIGRKGGHLRPNDGLHAVPQEVHQLHPQHRALDLRVLLARGSQGLQELCDPWQCSQGRCLLRVAPEQQQTITNNILLEFEELKCGLTLASLAEQVPHDVRLLEGLLFMVHLCQQLHCLIHDVRRHFPGDARW
mmetsp:Transcript_20708/g.36991  ORF Transcript_20708/g.36991 Transcript_20708/m.36991 type:complete len:319 (+) Transcript_20708:1222-2178(+)